MLILVIKYSMAVNINFKQIISHPQNYPRTDKVNSIHPLEIIFLKIIKCSGESHPLPSAYITRTITVTNSANKISIPIILNIICFQDTTHKTFLHPTSTSQQDSSQFAQIINTNIQNQQNY